jgi:hypothetical protein
MVNILQLSNKDIINIHRVRDTPSYRRLRPFELTTQRGWAIGLNSRNVADYMNLADVAAILNAAPTLNVTTASDYVSGNGQNNTDYRTKINNQVMKFQADTRFGTRPLSAPSDVRQIFNVISGDQGNSSDPVGNRHRCELDGGNVSFTGGTEIWLSYALKINPSDAPSPEMGILDVPGAFALCGQWHGNDVKTPPLSVNFKDGKIGIWTTSSALLDGVDGVLVERYRAAAKMTTGEWHYIVIRMITGDGTTGSQGTLQFYLDGTLVLDHSAGGALARIPIGYYLIGGNATYLNYGLYCADYEHPDVVAAGAGAVAAALAAVSELEYANVEYGTTNLFARVATPLAIT